MPGYGHFIQFSSPAEDVYDSLQKLLVERKVEARQKMLDALASKREQALEDDRLMGRKLQQAQLDQMEALRRAQEDEARRRTAAGVADVLTPGGEIDDQTAQQLADGGLSALVQRQAAALPSVAISGVARAGAGAPVIEDATATANEGHPERSVFRGTPAQIQAEQMRRQREAFLSKLPEDSPIRQYLLANPNAKDVPATMFTPKDTDTPIIRVNPRTGKMENLGTAPKGSHFVTEPAPTTVNVGGGELSSKPEDIARDAEDVLMGRNTLYNIRQSMGRSDKTGAYMKRMRAAIQAQDPEFDFVASDAGGKAVSSSYYQRGVAAVNAVMPNLDKIQKLSAEVPRVGVAGVDRLLQGGKMQFGDKKVTSLHQARLLLADEIGAALGQGAASDMKLQLGFDVTNPAVTDENFFANIDIIREFLDNRKRGLESLRYRSGSRQEPSAESPAGSTDKGRRVYYDANGNPIKR